MTLSTLLDEPLKILIMSHAHPSKTAGGAGVAAHRLYLELKARPDVLVWFLGTDLREKDHETIFVQPFTSSEFLYLSNQQFEWFHFANRDSKFVDSFSELIRSLEPDVVHLHHYGVFGVEIIHVVKRLLPLCSVVLTLHEFQAICNHYGQMVRKYDFSLCGKASPDACRSCFPGVSKSEFVFRERYIKLFFEQVDEFVCPSEFVSKRYVDWGLEGSRMSVIENVVASRATGPTQEEIDSSPLRIGFFGQISRLKGIFVLLECAAILETNLDIHITFEIHGDVRSQPSELRDEFLKRIEKLTSNVNFRGTYENDEVDILMQRVDAVLVPSIWWENSPVVIQEAFRNRRPVICSNIGGMAEKVRSGVDGLHFPVGNSMELSYLLIQLYRDRKVLDRLRKSMREPADTNELVDQHILLYTRLRTSKKTQP